MPPYIKADRKNLIDDAMTHPETPGELNYAITSFCIDYLGTATDHGLLTYQAINDVIGALEAAKLEFYRRVVIPFENTKIQQNGDVY